MLEITQRTVSHWSKLILRLINNEFKYLEVSGVVTENETNMTCENLTRRFEMLTFQQAISVQR